MYNPNQRFSSNTFPFFSSFHPTGTPSIKLTAQADARVTKAGEPLSCRRIAIPASSRRRGTQSVKRRCRAKYGSCYTLLIIRLKMISYYFAPPKLRFWVAGGCSLDFLFRFASRQNEKQDDRRVRKNRTIYLNYRFALRMKDENSRWLLR